MGQVEFHVIGNDGKVQSIYNKVFDVELMSLRLADTDQNNHFEPGEKIKITDIRVRNSGGMPLPKERKVHIFLKHSDWIIAKPMTLTLPESLAPGEIHAFTKQNIAFDLKDISSNHIGESPFKVGDLAQLGAFQEGTLKVFPKFQKPKAFKISFPIQVSAIRSLRSIEPGYGSRMMWKVKNVSKHKFGSASELKRKLAMKLQLNNQNTVKPEDIVFFDSENKPVNLEDGFFKAIAGLEHRQNEW